MKYLQTEKPHDNIWMYRRPDWRLILLSVSLALMLAAVGPVRAAPPAELVIPVCEPAPQLDAGLTDPAWQKALKATGFSHVGAPGGKPARVQTTAWLCRDDTWLYIAFRCDEPTGLNLKDNVRERDANVSDDDSVEVFLDPGADGKRYYQFILTVGNVQADQACEGSNRNRKWNLPWRSAAKRDAHLDTATGWSAEIALPLAMLQESAGPGPWKINLCRNRHASGKSEFSSLAPVPADTGFHSPQAFRPAKGLNDFKASMPFGPMIAGYEILPLQAAKTGYTYGVKVSVENSTGKGGTVEVVAEDLPQEGKGHRVAQVVTLGLVDQKDVVCTVPMASAGVREAQILLRDPETGFLLQRQAVTGLERMSPLEAYPERNYYTSEKEALVRVDLQLSKEDLKHAGAVVAVTVKNAKGQTLFSGEMPAAHRRIAMAVPLDRIPDGRHAVQVTLLSVKKGAGNECHRMTMAFKSKSAKLGSVNTFLVKKAPAPQGANELKIDFYRRSLILNGKPWFPIGAFGMGHQGRLKDSAFQLRRYEFAYQAAAEAGLDMMTDWKGFGASKPVEDCKIDYDLCQKYGLKVFGRLTLMEEPDANFASPKFFEWARKQYTVMGPYLEFCRTHPAVVGYYHFDEPYGGLNLDQIFEEFTTKVHEQNPHFLVYMSLTRHIHPSQRAWFGTIADLIGAHNYWYVTDPDGLNRNAESFEKLDEESRRARRPTMDAPQIDDWNGFMTPHEQRAQTYFALIHGAKSLMYFAMPWRSRSGVETQKRISAEVRELAPALLERVPDQEVSFEPKEAVIPGTQYTFPAIQTKLFTGPDGDQFLLAINASYCATGTVAFSVSSLGPQAAVETLLGGQPAIPVKDGAFTDTIEPWGTRAYRLKNVSWDEDVPVKIHLAMTFPAGVPLVSVKTAAEPSYGPNLMKNAGFEEGKAGWAWSTAAEIAEPPTVNPNAGKACLRFNKKTAGEMVEIISEPVPLKSNAKYRYGGWARMAISEGKEMPCFIILSVKAVENVRRVNGLVYVPATASNDWQQVTGVITAPDGESESVWLYCRVPKSIAGEVCFDDIFIEEIVPPAVVEKPRRKNLLFNSSFEESRIPGAPHGWAVVAEIALIPDPQSCAQDDRNPYHGKYSYRLVKESNAYVYTRTSVNGTPGKPYTLSVYMRAERPRANVSLYYWGGKTDFIVDTEWKRYSATAPAKKSTLGFGWYLGGDSTVYFDAAQLEEGTEATDYEEAVDYKR